MTGSIAESTSESISESISEDEKRERAFRTVNPERKFRASNLEDVEILTDDSGGAVSEIRVLNSASLVSRHVVLHHGLLTRMELRDFSYDDYDDPTDFLGYVIRGEMEFAVDRARTRLGPGGTVFIPAGATFDLVMAEADGPVEMLIVKSFVAGPYFEPKGASAEERLENAFRTVNPERVFRTSNLEDLEILTEDTGDAVGDFHAVADFRMLNSASLVSRHVVLQHLAMTRLELLDFSYDEHNGDSQDVLGYVSRGEVEFAVGGDRRRLGPGGTVLIPAGKKFDLVVAEADGPVEMLVIKSFVADPYFDRADPARTEDSS